VLFELNAVVSFVALQLFIPFSNKHFYWKNWKNNQEAADSSI